MEGNASGLAISGGVFYGCLGFRLRGRCGSTLFQAANREFSYMIKIKYGKLKQQMTCAALAVTAFGVSTAYAIPEEAKTAAEGIKTDIGEWVGLGFGIAAVGLAGSVGIKLFKKYVNKAT